MADSASISVIVPVFDVAPYIERCIESLESQHLEGLEFIFVDDRGTDASTSAVEAFAARDGRVRVVHNPRNLGAGPSRNVGIEVAHGEYLAFVDPDDWVSEDFFERLWQAAQQSELDIVKGMRVTVQEQGGHCTFQEEPDTKIERGLAQGGPLYKHFYYGHMTAIYKRTLFEDGSVRYGSTPKGEDTTFLLRAGSKAKSFTCISDARYYYLKREGSATSAVTPERFEAEFASFKEQTSFLVERGLDEHALDYLRHRFKIIAGGFCRAARENDALQSYEPQFIKGLLAEGRSIPCHDKLVGNSAELAALFEHGFLISPIYYELSNDFHRDQIVRWTNFIVGVEAEQADAFARAYATEILRCMSLRPDASAEDKPVVSARDTMRKQLSRLSTRFKLRVAANILRNIFDIAVSRSKHAQPTSN